MDVRNIQIEPLELNPAQYLHKMYELGSTQLKGYLKIEKLPDYPLNINPAGSQVILKDFIGRVIEELTEGYESTSEVVKALDKVGWNISLLGDKGYKDLLNHLQNANEEQADAIGFYMTLLLYSNILPEDIYEYVALNLEEEVNSLDKLMSYGVKLLYEIDPDRIKGNVGYPLFTEILATEYGIDYEKVNAYTPGFHYMNAYTHDVEVFYLWQVTYQLNIARNLLKNRPWKQTQVMSKEVDYQEAIVKSFLMYLGFLTINGFDDHSLFMLFYRKQQLNLWRQRTGY